MILKSAGAVELIHLAVRIRRLMSAGVAFLAVTLAAERLGYAGAYRHATSPVSIVLQLVFASPAILYLAALWQLRVAAAAVAAGMPFGLAVVHALDRTGACLIGGAALSLAMPLAHAVVRDNYPRLIELDVATLILAAIGVGLVFLARIVARAAAVQTELDAIF
jgi:hypothetical protein